MARSKSAGAWKHKNTIQCSKGYKWVRKGRRALLMRMNNNTGVTVECTCSLSGGCDIVVDQDDGTKIACVNRDCEGVCSWRFHIPGIPRIPPIRF